MNKQSKTMRLTLMGLFAAVLLLMAYTPLGYLNIGPLAITFNVIPVALAAITLGPVGGAAMGPAFCNASAWEAPAPWEQCFLASTLCWPSSSVSSPDFWTDFCWDMSSVTAAKP